MFEEASVTFDLPHVRAIGWQGEDGTPVEGLLHYPLGHPAVGSSSSPAVEPPRALIVSTHGGPASSNVFTWVSEREYIPQLCARGYFVLQPNYRGSTGYGHAFSDDVIGHYFHNMLPDVLRGVDALVEQGLVDPERLGKRGYSAGGVLTKWAVTQTTRFKAAAAGAGASDWQQMYCLGDLRGHRVHWFGGEPWDGGEVLDKYRQHSPQTFVRNVRTPTLLHSGDKDQRNPLWENLLFFRALRARNVPTHLYVYPGQAHGGWTLESNLMRANADLAWFEHWLVGREWQWEEPPIGYTKQPSIAWHPVAMLGQRLTQRELRAKL